MPVCGKINIEVSSNGGEVLRFRSATEIVWKEIYAWDDWESYQYGLKFVQMPNEDYLNFRHSLLKDSSNLEAQFADQKLNPKAM